MRFDLTDLSLFRHVAEAGSITHGAARAHLALAAASTRIRNMEQALGAPLLLRSRQGVTPTQAGRTLLQHARVMLAQAERLREDLGADRVEERFQPAVELLQFPQGRVQPEPGGHRRVRKDI